VLLGLLARIDYAFDEACDGGRQIASHWPTSREWLPIIWVRGRIATDGSKHCKRTLLEPVR
jgi:hypothetical protein